MSTDEKRPLDPSTEELKKIRHQLKELTEAVYAMAGVMLMTGMPQNGPEGAVTQLHRVRTVMSSAEFCEQEKEARESQAAGRSDKK